MNKQARQFAIKDLIATVPIGSQHDLRGRLRRAGIRVTQATLSRDMKELGVSKVTSTGGARYTLQGQASEARILKPLVGAEVLSVDANEALVVVRTLPGCANTVGEFVDVLADRDIIGTVAGDNTLLVIPRTGRKARQVAQLLKDKFIGER